MKLRHKNFFTKKKIIIIILGIVLLSGGGAYALNLMRLHPSGNDQPLSTSSTSSQSTDTKKVNQSPATPEQVQAGNNAKLNTVQQNSQQQTNPPTPASFTIAITAANQTNSTVTIRSLISGVISQNGTCTITITNGTKSTTNTAATQALADSSTCQGFNIPVSQLGAGTWDIGLSATINGKSASTTKTMTVN